MAQVLPYIYLNKNIFQLLNMKIELLNLKNSYKENEYIFDDNNRSSNMILKIKTSYGWRTIDSPYDPEEEAVKSI